MSADDAGAEEEHVRLEIAELEEAQDEARDPCAAAEAADDGAIEYPAVKGAR